MYKTHNDILGHFRKYRTNFASFDDGNKVHVQITSKSKNYSYDKFKKYYMKERFINILSTSDFTVITYVYHISYIWYLDDKSFDIYYDYRLEKYNDRKCFSLVFTSKDIDVFGQHFGFLESIRSAIVDKSFDIQKCDNIIDFKINELNYNVFNMISSPQVMKHNISFTTVLLLEVDKELNYADIINIYNNIHTLISFCCMKKNIIFKNVELYDCKEENGRLPYGSLYKPNNINEHNGVNYFNNMMIRIDSIKEIIGSLYKNINDGTIELNYIPNDTDSFNSNFVNSTSWLQNFFRKWAASNSRFVLKKIDVLDTNILTEKNKPKKVTFVEMIQHLIDYTKDYLEDVCKTVLGFSRFFLDTKEYELKFAERIKSMRNDFCHGHIDYKAEYYKYCISDLKLLNIYLYSSILKYVGITKEDCNKAIKQLFDINGFYS